MVAGKNAQGKPIEELHAEGSYKMNHNGTWLDAAKLGFVTQRQLDSWVYPQEMTHPPRGKP